jgi:hypothetical protein
MQSLLSVSDVMRHCAEMAENFSASLAEELASNNGNDSKADTGGSEEHIEVKKRKRVVKPKDPNAPKRPPTSFLLFQNEQRKSLREKHPEMSHSDLIAKVAQIWHSLPQEGRKVRASLSLEVVPPTLNGSS